MSVRMRASSAGMVAHGAEYHNTSTRDKFYPVPNQQSDSPARTNLIQKSAVNMADGDALAAHLTFKVPDDFDSLVSAHAVVLPGGTGNMYWSVETSYCANGEAYNTHSDWSGNQIDAVSQNIVTEMPDVVALGALANLAAGDYVGFKFYRAGNNAADTVNANVYYLGCRFVYVGTIPID